MQIPNQAQFEGLRDLFLIYTTLYVDEVDTLLNTLSVYELMAMLAEAAYRKGKTALAEETA